MASDKFEFVALRYKFIYSMAGLFLGLVSMIGGIVLFLHGVAGSTSWTAKILGNQSTITDAGPGAVLFVVGLFVVLVTRFRGTVRTSSKESGDGTREFEREFLYHIPSLLSRPDRTDKK